MQISFYYKMLSVKAKAQGRTVSRTLVVDYIDRSNSKLFAGYPFKSLPTKPEDDEYLTPIKNKLLHVKEGITTGALPKRICDDINSSRARNCDLASICFGLKGKRIDRPVHRGSRPGAA